MGRFSDSISRVYLLAKQGQWSVFLPALLVFYSFIKEIKVADPFLYKYQSEFQNLTAATLNGEIYPYFAYACLIATVPIFLFTDIFLYKPTMYLEVLGQLAYRFALVFRNDVLSQQIGHALWGISTASDVGCYSYIYGIFEKDQYRKITSWSRAAIMSGRTGGYILAQFLILAHIGNYKTLNEITFYILCAAVVFCFLLPRVSWRQVVANIGIEQSKKKSHKIYAPLPTSFREYVLYRLRKLKSDFVTIYSNTFILKWSFWWAMAVCMFLQVNLYAQTLLGQVQVKDDNPLNGFADAAYTFIATVFILLTYSFPINWDKWGEIVLVMISTLDAVFLALFSQTNSVYLMYFCYIFYRSFYQVMVTIAQWNIARKMVTDSYGLVFGVDYFIALVMQSLLTVIVTDTRGLGMQVRDAFLVYAGLHALISLLFSVSIVYSIISYYRNKGKVMPSRQTTVKSARSASTRKLSESAKKVSMAQEPTELSVTTIAGQLDNVDIHSTTSERGNAESISIASELNFNTDDDFESDEDDFMTTKSSAMAAFFSTSFNKM
ncbi:hypothetical protein FO519_009237 [Halicephalobus sp. NKZ332]|nr:hypothetical protein FO519_009237 [Halicephalobus sp. NKZ332]